MNLKKLREQISQKCNLIQEKLSDLFFKKYSCVLLVDDEELSNYFNKRLIESLEITNKVKYVSSGEDGLKFLKRIKNKHFPLLILIDTAMPVMDGFEFLELAIFCNFIKEDGVTIAFLTSDNCQNTEIIKEKGFENYTFLSKPLNKDKMRVFFN